MTCWKTSHHYSQMPLLDCDELRSTPTPSHSLARAFKHLTLLDMDEMRPLPHAWVWGSMPLKRLAVTVATVATIATVAVTTPLVVESQTFHNSVAIGLPQLILAQLPHGAAVAKIAVGRGGEVVYKKRKTPAASAIVPTIISRYDF